MDLRKYIIDWNIKYPYDKKWRDKHNIPLFSEQHKSMCLVDILLEDIESTVYSEAIKEYKEKEKAKEEQTVLSLRDREYIPGLANFLKSQEDSMNNEEIDELFNKINI